MRASDLPRLGVIQNPLDGDIFGKWVDLADRDILCLGMSEEQVDNFLAPHRPKSVSLLTLWEDHVDSTSTRYPLVFGDITQRTDFPDNSVDTIITMSVLEHVSDVQAALQEMGRLARTDMLHIFGPAWSCAYGHHLCTGSDHESMNFYRWSLPAHLHLLCSKDEVCDFYEQEGLSRETGEFVYDQFHDNNTINRVFYDAYVTAMHGFQVARWETMYNRLPTEHLHRLQRQFPGAQDFSTYGGCYHLLV